MYQSLAPCPSCSRHVRTTEASCPFCKNALPATLAGAAIPGATQRLSRAAAFAFTASLAVTGCGGTTVSPTPGDSGTGAKDGAGIPEYDGAGIQPPYGLPPFDAAPPEDAGPDDAGGIGVKYGAPPIDAGNG